ncbi:hypothetical protein K466DRAFT_504227, partial [Polyporus arcularius HHB13444]
LTKRIYHSPELTQELAELCEKEKIKPLRVVRSVPTRWNSVAAESKRAIELRVAIEALVNVGRHGRTRGTRLKRYKLSKEQWELLTQLQPVLTASIFVKATERMSVSGRPLLYQTILLFDILEKKLKQFCESPKLHPLVRYGCTLGRDVLNKYYEKTDDSIMYRLAIS